MGFAEENKRVLMVFWRLLIQVNSTRFMEIWRKRQDLTGVVVKFFWENLWRTIWRSSGEKIQSEFRGKISVGT